MVALTTAVGELLKTTYENTAHDHINTKDHIVGLMPKDYDADGEEFVSLHRTGGTNSMGFQAESTVLPTAGSQQWANGTITPKEWWGTLELSQRLISLSKTKLGSFLKGFDGEVYGFSRDFRRFLEIRIMGDGTGALGQVVLVTPTPNNALSFSTPIPLRKLYVGQKIVVWDTQGRNAAATELQWDNPGTTSEMTVQSINPNVNSVVVDEAINAASALGVAGTGFLGQSGARTATGRLEIMGMDGAILDRDSPMEDVGQGGSGFQGIIAPSDFSGSANANGEATWRSPTFRNGGTNRPVTESLLQQACDAVEIGSNGLVDTFVCPYGVRLDFALDQLTIRRNMNTPSLSGPNSPGFSEDVDGGRFVQYGGYRIIPQRFCPANTVFALSWSRQGLKFWARPQWWDDGNILRRNWEGRTSYNAEMFSFLEYYLDERNAHARIEDVDGTEVAA